MPDAIIVTIEDGVADVRINRPEKRNAVDGEVLDGMLAAIKDIGANKKIRAVVLSGEGKGFCTGIDMASFESRAPVFTDDKQ